MSKEIVIIGAGPGGLVNAILLAHAGHRVTMLEKQPYVGGRTSTFELDGFQFDLGPTFFLYPEMLKSILSEVGCELDEVIPMKRLDPQYRLVFGQGGRLDASPDIRTMEREIDRLSPGDVAGFHRFMEENRSKLHLFEPILKRPFSSFTDLLQTDILRALPVLRPWLSLHGDVSRHFQDSRLRLAFTFQGKYLGMSPFQCPSLFSILSFLEYEHGVFHPIGGCGALMRRLAQLARRLGVDIHLEEPVTGLKFAGRRIVGVQTRRCDYSADAVVVGADFANAMTTLVPNELRRQWNNSRINRAKFSCSTFMMYLGIEGRFDDLPHHTIYLSNDYQNNLDQIRSGKLPDDPSVYVQNACVTDFSLAPDGCSTLYVLVPVANTKADIDWSNDKYAFRERVMRQIERLGICNIEKRIRVERVITPTDWRDRFGIHHGATFNLSHSLDQMLMFRPHNRFEDIDGMYLVGGGTHPGSGLPTIFSSAKITADLIRQDLEEPRRSTSLSGKSGRKSKPVVGTNL